MLLFASQGERFVRETYLRALRRAVQVHGLGAVASLVARSESHVRAWLAGEASIPDGAFLRLVDLIADDPPSISEENASPFRIITNAEFLAFSRAEKLSYLRSAIRAHQEFARQKAMQTEKSEQELLGIVRKEIPTAGDLNHAQRQDDARIDPDQEHDLDYWCAKLGVSRDELRKAVQAAGPMAKDVRRHLGC
jgi:hypothetical protein